MYNKQTNAHLIDNFIILFLFIAATCFDANMSSPGSSHSVLVKLHTSFMFCWPCISV